VVSDSIGPAAHPGLDSSRLQVAAGVCIPCGTLPRSATSRSYSSTFALLHSGENGRWGPGSEETLSERSSARESPSTLAAASALAGPRFRTVLRPGRYGAPLDQPPPISVNEESLCCGSTGAVLAPPAGVSGRRRGALPRAHAPLRPLPSRSAITAPFLLERGLSGRPAAGHRSHLGGARNPSVTRRPEAWPSRSPGARI